MNKVNYPFRVVVNKEISDHVKSWRFIILMGIILLTCMGSLYTSLTNIGAAIKPNDPDGSFLFLKLFTASDGTLPSFVQFINFLGPLLGIALGFDAINSEQNKGTLSRMLSQPVHRDCIINAKFVAALIVIGIMLFVLGFLVMGCGLIAIGIPPTAEEFWWLLVVAVTNSPKHDFNRCKSATCRFLFRDTKSARDKNGTKPRKNKVKDTSPEISLVEYLCFVCKGTNLSLEKRGEIPISLIHNSFSYHCTPNVVIANGFDLKQHDLRKSGVKFCFAL